MRKFFREQWKTSYPENRLFYSIYSYFLITSKKTKKKEITTFLDTNKCLMEKWKICKIHKKCFHSTQYSKSIFTDKLTLENILNAIKKIWKNLIILKHSQETVH